MVHYDAGNLMQKIPNHISYASQVSHFSDKRILVHFINFLLELPLITCTKIVFSNT
jgi:hypothetical protein